MNLCIMCGSAIKEFDVYCGACGSKIGNNVNNPMVTQYAISPKDIQFKLGLVYIKQEKFEQAAKVYKTILKDDPQNNRAKENLEKARLMQKSFNIGTL